VKPTVKWAARVLPLLLILSLESGCTYSLWTDGNLDAYREPAPTPNLHLYQSQKKNDYLVVYNEYSERSDRTYTRAYWLNKNENRVEDKSIPAFAAKKSADHLPPVPVFYSVPQKPDLIHNLYAVCSTNEDTFALYSDNREIGSYELPFYKDRRGTAEKIALTPVTVTADAGIATGYVGAFCLYCWLESGCYIPASGQSSSSSGGYHVGK
jgi:hypothetical protein